MKLSLKYLPHTSIPSEKITHYLLAFCVVLGLYAFPAAAKAFYEINILGGECDQIGEWNTDTRTCTLMQDIDEQVIVVGPFITFDGNGHIIDLSKTSENFGVKVDGVEAVTVQNTTVIEGGIQFDGADSGEALYNTFKSTFVGIDFFDMNTGLAEGNVIAGMDDVPISKAITAQDTVNITLRNNRIGFADMGIVLDQADYSTLEHNLIEEAFTGIKVRSMEDGTITSNIVSESGEAALEIDGDQSKRNTISSNTFKDSDRGIVVRVSGGGGPGPVLTFSDQTPSTSRQLAREMIAWFRNLIPFAQAQVHETNVFFKNNFINNNDHVAVDLGADVQFSLPLPDGGNYWDTYDEERKGCVDEDPKDGFCDIAYELEVPEFIIDEFPRIEPVDVDLPASQCSDGEDNDDDGLTDFPEDPGCDNANDNNEINVPPPSAPTCTLSAEPAAIIEGESATLSWTSENADGGVIDHSIGDVTATGSVDVSPVTDTTYTATFTGSGGEVSCQTTVRVEEETPPEQTLGEKAAELAKHLLEETIQQQADPADVYELGSRGWNYADSLFVDPYEIVDGYYQKNNYYGYEKIAPGIDCSGLIYWAFNKANNPILSEGNYVANLTADGMYHDVQSNSVVGEPQPGDALFFDKYTYYPDTQTWVVGSDGVMDHVAMYVGESGGYDIVNVSSEDVGIVGRLKSNYETDPYFVEHRHIHQNGFAGAGYTSSPVNMIFTDPDGYTLAYDDIIPSDQELIREIPGELYYSEIQQGHDGQSEDYVYFTKLKDGTYSIKVIPDETATSGDTYSLTFTAEDTIIQLATNEPISDIPPQGFAIEVSEDSVEEVEVPLTPEVLFDVLAGQVDEAEIKHDFLKWRLEVHVRLAQKLYERGKIKASISVLKNMRWLTSRRGGRGIDRSDAREMKVAIKQLIKLLK